MRERDEQGEQRERRDRVESAEKAKHRQPQASGAVGRHTEGNGDDKAGGESNGGQLDVLAERAQNQRNVRREPVPIDPRIHGLQEYPRRHSDTLIEP